MTEATKTGQTGPGVERLFGAGAHFAQVKSRRHPTMRSFVLGNKANLEIFDLQKTDAQLAKAKEVMATLARDGKVVLIVGGKREASDAVKATGKRLGIPYVAGRWLGGTISNFTEIKKRIDRLADLSEKRDTGELAKLYTKLERVRIDREIDKLTLRLSGLGSLARRPDAMIIVDTRHEAHASREAKSAGIPVIGIMSSDCNLKDAAYPIVVNDASRSVIDLVLNELAEAYEAGLKG
ncbi:30S ribosomal protein S2 [Patescibacteria group bacterium]|nr:30S ribosomal protein S2 [Patescibacteria group bacterium]MBU1501086.1 30S ribosomal protein S2 [Patescibacteria group bacterium]MBU2081041.1 30S ribosomal protein S2 [Patescibacteria group bacterium]MBU2124132.1 30S ribosomal protein S2 [Patescibacteria group bacterium]MBU2194988.1 30S ribosomal protein S2 [Patescibacteria group bacterium]